MRPQRDPSPLHLGPVPESSARARRFVREWLTALEIDALIDSAELGVSELVTNACLHARTPITVALHLRKPGVVRIEVTDDSSVPPEERDFGSMLTTTGRGLRLLSAYGTWGIEPGPRDGAGKTVWFEPSAEHSVRPAASESLDEWADL